MYIEGTGNAPNERRLKTMKYEITKNEKFNSIEVAFDEKPSVEVRDALKALRFRWHNVNKVWYGYTDEETIRKALEGAKNGEKVTKVTKATKKAEKAEKVNKYGVKVGDVFYMNWGYEQTNIDYFQVVALVGEASVRIRHVLPTVIDTDGVGPMSANYTYNITPEPMRPDNCGVFIKDNDKGDLKRVCKSGDSVYLNMTSYANAYKIPFGVRKEYVSWYA